VVTDASLDVEKSQLPWILSEMAMFESSGKRGRRLKLVYRYLLIPIPAVSRQQSTQKERFSAAGVLHESAIATE